MDRLFLAGQDQVLGKLTVHLIQFLADINTFTKSTNKNKNSHLLKKQPITAAFTRKNLIKHKSTQKPNNRVVNLKKSYT